MPACFLRLSLDKEGDWRDEPMAGESGAGSKELYQTPTWAVAGVCAVMIIISLLLEKFLHKLGTVSRVINK